MLIMCGLVEGIRCAVHGARLPYRSRERYAAAAAQAWCLAPDVHVIFMPSICGGWLPLPFDDLLAWVLVDLGM